MAQEHVHTVPVRGGRRRELVIDAAVDRAQGNGGVVPAGSGEATKQRMWAYYSTCWCRGGFRARPGSIGRRRAQLGSCRPGWLRYERSRHELFDQLPAQDFPGRSCRKDVDETDQPGAFVGSEPLSRMVNQLALGGRGTVREHDVGAGEFPRASSGTGPTATIATAGWSASTRSISAGYTL